MKSLKLFTLLTFASLIFSSCDKEAEDQITYFSVGQIVKEVPVVVNNTDGLATTVNSNAVVNLNSSVTFKENINNLEEVEVTMLTFKIKELTANQATTFSNIEIYVDEIKISKDDLKLDSVITANNEAVFTIENKEILAAISSKLFQRKQVVVSYYSKVRTEETLNFQIEYCFIAKGTFLD